MISNLDLHTWNVFLSSGIGICAILVVMNVYNYRKRGFSSLVLATGCVFLGLFFLGLKSKASPFVMGVVGSIFVACVLGDMVIRMAKQARGGKN